MMTMGGISALQGCYEKTVDGTIVTIVEGVRICESN